MNCGLAFCKLIAAFLSTPAASNISHIASSEPSLAAFIAAARAIAP